MHCWKTPGKTALVARERLSETLSVTRRPRCRRRRGGVRRSVTCESGDGPEEGLPGSVDGGWRGARGTASGRRPGSRDGFPRQGARSRQHPTRSAGGSAPCARRADRRLRPPGFLTRISPHAHDARLPSSSHLNAALPWDFPPSLSCMPRIIRSSRMRLPGRCRRSSSDTAVRRRGKGMSWSRSSVSDSGAGSSFRAWPNSR